MDWSGRVERARHALSATGVDCLIVTHLPNVRYLTGFTGSAGILLLMPSRVILLTDFRYEGQAEAEVEGRCQVEIVPLDVWGRALALVADCGDCRRVGYESHVLSVQAAGRFAEVCDGFEMVATGEVIEPLRAVKEPQEVDEIRRAARVATTALERVLSGLKPGMREIEVAANLERELRLLGSEWHPFETIVASGPQSALPHAGTSTRSIEKGDFVLFDFGAIVGGYCSDITRTVVMGTANDKQREVYDVVRDAQRAACEMVSAGMPGKDADHVARSLIERRGYGENFGHSLGHGLGLEVHEAPRLARTATDPLPAHSVVTVEPGIYIPGWGGVRIEDDVYLDDGNSELLSHFHTELIEIH